MPDFDATAAALRKWTATRDPHVRAAVELLIWHEHWVRHAGFQRACIERDRNETWIRWHEAREFYDSGPRASTSVLA